MITYQHRFTDGRTMAPGKIICVGRNYAEHAHELGNAIPEEPLLFMKPTTALTPIFTGVSVPTAAGACHVETEISLLIGERITAQTGDVLAAIAGVGIALDLTLRDLQSKLKQAGHPWEKAKAFDGSCPTSAFVDATRVADWQTLTLELERNGQRQQYGNSAQMLFGIEALLAYIARWFTLLPGDMVLTGTPAGVCALAGGDHLSVRLNDDWMHEEAVVSERVTASTG
jgi:2-keto-4-pentenoate hydratase/2-oxohepta-3-ene-1,7-dioic acid hydratase in catechol pathway